MEGQAEQVTDVVEREVAFLERMKGKCLWECGRTLVGRIPQLACQLPVGH